MDRLKKAMAEASGGINTVGELIQELKKFDAKKPVKVSLRGKRFDTIATVEDVPAGIERNLGDDIVAIITY